MFLVLAAESGALVWSDDALPFLVHLLCSGGRPLYPDLLLLALTQIVVVFD